MELLSLKVEDEDFLKLGPQQRREKTFEAIRDVLIRASQERPLVLAVEDMHWIDKTSEEFLDYLIGWLASARILLILLYRPEYTHQWGSKSYYGKIGLNQLTAQSSAELVQAILEGGEVSPGICAISSSTEPPGTLCTSRNSPTACWKTVRSRRKIISSC